MMARRHMMQTWTSSFWLTSREFFNAFLLGKVLQLAETGQAAVSEPWHGLPCDLRAGRPQSTLAHETGRRG